MTAFISANPLVGDQPRGGASFSRPAIATRRGTGVFFLRPQVGILGTLGTHELLLPAAAGAAPSGCVGGGVLRNFAYACSRA